MTNCKAFHVLLALCVGLGGCEPRRTAERHAGLARATAPASASAPAAAPTHVPAAAIAAFQRRALNVLLLPLLEDEDPPRWREPAVAGDCGATARISVDGAPMVAGAAVPARAFELAWSGSRCGGLGDDIVELSGSVRLHVFHDGDAYSAVVEPEGLRVVTGGAAFVLDRRFAAVTPLAPPGPEPELDSR